MSFSNSSTVTNCLKADIYKYFQEHPKELSDNLLSVAVWVNANTTSLFSLAKKTKKPLTNPFAVDKVKVYLDSNEVQECLYSLKILDELNASFAKVELHDSSLESARMVLCQTAEYCKNLVKMLRRN